MLIPMISRQAVSSYSAIKPPTLSLTVTSGLIQHVMASEGITLDTDDNVSLWEDQSSAGNDWAGITIDGPSVVESAINGLPVLRFSGVPGSGPYQRLLLSTAPLANGEDGEIFAVMLDNRAANVSQGHWDLGNLSQLSSLLHFTDSNLYEGFGKNPRATVAEFTSGQGYGIYNVSAEDGGNHVVRWNGVDKVTNAGLSSNYRPGSWTIGGVSNSYNFDGDYAEIIMYDRVLSESERSEVEEYLNNKYDL